MALRTFAGLIVCLAIAGAIGVFVGLHLTLGEAQQIVGQELGRRLLAGSTLAYLLTPYTAAQLGTLAPICAWAIAGFVGGLITKSPLKGAIMAILSVAIAWVSFSIIAGSMAGLSISETFQGFSQATRSMAGDLAVAGAACIIPAVIGGAITEGDRQKIIIKKIGLGGKE